ncbi:recombination repair protein 1 [Danaus plexippus]|uniref:recombination repair protein 1 n=1 Tax=Danaus plexippus TaxID=13037 RepID=UPI002AB2C4FE|nr:recombination repair protein 1 [Danaus plexippus]
MAPRTAKAKKNADVKVSEGEVPKKGRGKAKNVTEQEQVVPEVVIDKNPSVEKKTKRGKNAVVENNDEAQIIVKDAPPAKKGRKKAVEEPIPESNSLNGDNSDENEPAVQSDDNEQNEEHSESNDNAEDTQASAGKGRKKVNKKEPIEKEVKPKETGRGKKNVKQENITAKKDAEEKPKARGRGRKVQPKAEDVQDNDEVEVKPKGRKKAQPKVVEKVQKADDEDDEQEEIPDEEAEEEKPVEEVKKKGRKNADKKTTPKEDSEQKDDEVKEQMPVSKSRKGAKKDEKAKGDTKDDDKDDVAESKPVKGKRGQKKAEASELQDTGEPINKRRRKDDKATEDNKKKTKAATDYESIDFSNKSQTSQGKEWNFKIANWNVDGIRAWMGKGGLDYLKYEKPDILCLQETKCALDKLPYEVKNIPGYHAYWLSSDKDGYAGVGIYTTKLAMNVQYGLQNEELDSEGRIITAEYEQFYLICTYVPNAGRKLVSLPKRLKWNDEFREHVKALDEKKPVIICGDMNVAHNEIDLTNPKTNKKNAGFTEEERAGMTELLGDGFVDTFRHFHPEKVAYTFWSYMANSRAKNVGWRLDYFIVSERLLPSICDSSIRGEVYGSDHCPIALYLHLTSADKPKE